VANPLVPLAPSGLTATVLTGGSIGLRWTNGSTSQAEVRIERCRGAGCTNFTQVAAVAGTATSFINTGLTARTTYRYRVRAHSALGDSPYSNVASARTKG
jgi:Fibronectin type III domain